MLNRDDVKCWPTARLHEELEYILAWLRQHIGFDQNFGQWSVKTHDMEVLQKELLRREREERDARRGR